MTAANEVTDEEHFAALFAEHERNEPGEPGEPTSWAPVDLTAYLDGTHQPAQAALLARVDGVRLAYAGRVHWLSGEPEALKSWLALLACSQVIIRGGRVVYIDLEDGAAGIVSRLLAMDIAPSLISTSFAYLAPDGALRHTTRDGLKPLVSEADIVIIDAATEALAAQGLSAKDDVDVASWMALLPRWAAKLGPAVIVIDHVIKDAENRGRWATGSQHKLAGLDGCAFTLEAVQPGGVGMTGRSRLYLSKDRHGQVRPHAVPSTGGKSWLGDLVVDSTGPFVDVALHPPAVRDPSEPFRPTVVMAKVSEALIKAGKPLSGRDLEARVTGKATVIRAALAALEDEGHVSVEAGPRGSRLHRLLNAYPSPEDPS